jgi:hypothetical protein
VSWRVNHNRYLTPYHKISPYRPVIEVIGCCWTTRLDSRQRGHICAGYEAYIFFYLMCSPPGSTAPELQRTEYKAGYSPLPSAEVRIRVALLPRFPFAFVVCCLWTETLPLYLTRERDMYKLQKLYLLKHLTAEKAIPLSNKYEFKSECIY